MSLLLVVIRILPENHDSQSLQRCQFERAKCLAGIREHLMLATFDIHETLKLQEVSL